MKPGVLSTLLLVLFAASGHASDAPRDQGFVDCTTAVFSAAYREASAEFVNKTLDGITTLNDTVKGRIENAFYQQLDALLDDLESIAMDTTRALDVCSQHSLFWGKICSAKTTALYYIKVAQRLSGFKSQICKEATKILNGSRRDALNVICGDRRPYKALNRVIEDSRACF